MQNNNNNVVEIKSYKSKDNNTKSYVSNVSKPNSYSFSLPKKDNSFMNKINDRKDNNDASNNRVNRSHVYSSTINKKTEEPKIPTIIKNNYSINTTNLRKNNVNTNITNNTHIYNYYYYFVYYLNLQLRFYLV